ncbi:hypothetical protein M2266_005867 [Streptomyces sp. SPB162]|nr:hypothetical protein [Streptomyces sp. SPB162]
MSAGQRGWSADGSLRRGTACGPITNRLSASVHPFPVTHHVECVAILEPAAKES